MLLRNMVSAEIREFPDAEAARILAHPWFGKWYVPADSVEFPPYVDQYDNSTLSQWVMDPANEGYLKQS